MSQFTNDRKSQNLIPIYYRKILFLESIMGQKMSITEVYDSMIDHIILIFVLRNTMAIARLR